MTRPLAGLWPPVSTPFGADGAPDTDRLVRHSHALLADGATGLAILGTTSEANSLSLAERRRVIDAHVEAGIAADRLLPGTGACAVEDVAELTRHAAGLGAAGVLMLPPFYYKNVSDDGLYAFVDRVIDRLGAKPPRILLYHIPPMAVVGWSIELIGRLREAFPGIVAGIKDSTGDWDHIKALLDAFPEDFAVFPGSELHLLAALRHGAAGCISATANVNAAAISALIATWRGSDAEAGQERLSELRRGIESWPMIPALKAILAERYGDPDWRRVRPPLVGLDEEQRRALLVHPAVARLRETIAA